MNLNLLEPSGPVQTYNGIALPFFFTLVFVFTPQQVCTSVPMWLRDEDHFGEIPLNPTD